MTDFICKKCGSTEYEIKDKPNGTGIAHGLYCAKCGFWHKWLGKEELKQYATKESKDEIIAKLQSENAALRKQISEMLTPRCTLGDKLYHYELSFGDGFDENGKVIHTSSMDIIETEVTRDNIWRMCDLVQNKRAFFSREALAASFKERFQKGREQFVKEIKDDKRRTD